MRAYIVDTETTGEEPVAECIELAIAGLEDGPEWHQFIYNPVFIGRFKPQGRITFRAMAVHHILPEELVEAEPSVLAKAYLPSDMEYMIGHKVDYDWEVLGRPACKRICTLAISQEIWPGNDGHSLGALTYSLTMPEKYSEARELLKGAHGAGVDVELGFALLASIFQQPQLHTTALGRIDSWEKLWLFSEEARIPKIWTFGKHKGKSIPEADRGYLLWCIRQDFIEEPVKIACRRVLDGGWT